MKRNSNLAGIISITILYDILITLTCRVPRGSVLSPILFYIYTGTIVGTKFQNSTETTFYDKRTNQKRVSCVIATKKKTKNYA